PVRASGDRDVAPLIHRQYAGNIDELPVIETGYSITLKAEVRLPVARADRNLHRGIIKLKEARIDSRVPPLHPAFHSDDFVGEKSWRQFDIAVGAIQREHIRRNRSADQGCYGSRKNR